MRRFPTRRSALKAGVATLAAPGLALASGFPSKPVSFIVNTPAGGQSDAAARCIANELAQTLGQPIVVENRPGANGTVGTNALARAAKDGHVLGIANQSSAVMAPLIMSVPYTLEDLQLVTMMYRGAMVLAVHQDLPVRNIREFVAHGRQQGVLSYGSFGTASPARITMELFAKEAGLQFSNVSYRGETNIATDLLAGHVPVYVGGSTPVLQHHRKGTVRILAISSEQRVPTLPDIPTFAEQGFRSVVFSWFHGIALPSGTPRAPVERWHQLLAPVLHGEKFKSILATDLVLKTTTPEEFTALAREERQWIGDIVRTRGIRADS